MWPHTVMSNNYLSFTFLCTRFTNINIVNYIQFNEQTDEKFMKNERRIQRKTNQRKQHFFLQPKVVQNILQLVLSHRNFKFSSKDLVGIYV